MTPFEIQRNIARFEMLLRDPALEPPQRQTVEKLLAEERQKLGRPAGPAAERAPEGLGIALAG